MISSVLWKKPVLWQLHFELPGFHLLVSFRCLTCKLHEDIDWVLGLLAFLTQHLAQCCVQGNLSINTVTVGSSHYSGSWKLSPQWFFIKGLKIWWFPDRKMTQHTGNLQFLFQGTFIFRGIKSILARLLSNKVYETTQTISRNHGIPGAVKELVIHLVFGTFVCSLLLPLFKKGRTVLIKVAQQRISIKLTLNLPQTIR